MSFVIDCEDHAEVDRLWESLTANGGERGPCGWLKDRFGLSWKIVPHRLGELVNDPDPERARRAMEAMLTIRSMFGEDTTLVLRNPTPSAPSAPTPR